jgi:hypothetical protein
LTERILGKSVIRVKEQVLCQPKFIEVSGQVFPNQKAKQRGAPLIHSRLPAAEVAGSRYFVCAD